MSDGKGAAAAGVSRTALESSKRGRWGCSRDDEELWESQDSDKDDADEDEELHGNEHHNVVGDQQSEKDAKKARHISGVVPSATLLAPGCSAKQRPHGFFSVYPAHKRWMGLLFRTKQEERADSFLCNRVSLSTCSYVTAIEAARAVDRCGLDSNNTTPEP